MTAPRKRIEYIAPFLMNRSRRIRSMLPTVIWRTTTAPSPLPRMMIGTDRVNANAPRTPSMEKVMSMISR
jgi:hypothetical protein